MHDDYNEGPPLHRPGSGGTGLQGQRGLRPYIRWLIQMIIREGRHAVITVLLTTASAEFDTESQMFLDEDRRCRSRC